MTRQEAQVYFSLLDSQRDNLRGFQGLDAGTGSMCGARGRDIGGGVVGRVQGESACAWALVQVLGGLGMLERSIMFGLSLVWPVNDETGRLGLVQLKCRDRKHEPV